MIVKNILISDKELFISLLIKELCEKGISYVLIENEIHFDDYILRFYDKEDIFTMNVLKDIERFSLGSEFFIPEEKVYKPRNIPNEFRRKRRRRYD